MTVGNRPVFWKTNLPSCSQYLFVPWPVCHLPSLQQKLLLPVVGCWVWLILVCDLWAIDLEWIMLLWILLLLFSSQNTACLVIYNRHSILYCLFWGVIFWSRCSNQAQGSGSWAWVEGVHWAATPEAEILDLPAEGLGLQANATAAPGCSEEVPSCDGETQSKRWSMWEDLKVMTG